MPSTAILPELQNFPAGLNTIVHELSWTSTSSGWINDAVYELWVDKIFIPYLDILRTLHDAKDAPALLWIDGHGSRASPIARDHLEKAGVTMVVIPAHTSHVMQPLDCGVNREFKNQLRRAYLHPKSSSIPEVRRALMEAAVKAHYRAVFPEIVRASFRRAGVFPWNPDLILNDPTKVRTDVSDTPAHNTTSAGSRQISGKVLVSPSVQRHTFMTAIPTVHVDPAGASV
jgi:DDE superfamily endonuclease